MLASSGFDLQWPVAQFLCHPVLIENESPIRLMVFLSPNGIKLRSDHKIPLCYCFNKKSQKILLRFSNLFSKFSSAI